MLNNYFNKNEVNTKIDDDIDDIVLYEGEKVSIDDIITNSEIEEKKIDNIIDERAQESEHDNEEEDEIQMIENKTRDDVEYELEILLSIRDDPKFNDINNKTKIKYLNTNFKQIQSYINYIKLCDWGFDIKQYFFNKIIENIGHHQRYEEKNNDSDIIDFYKKVFKCFEIVMEQVYENEYEYEDDEDDEIDEDNDNNNK